jgi:hypothetical protein
MRMARAACALWILLWLSGCGGATAPATGTLASESIGHARRLAEARAEAWPEADALFRQDPGWLGGDAAISVPLASERVLWLFGDSFVRSLPTDGTPPEGREDTEMVRNSVAIQSGLDPSRASMTFFTGHDSDGAPRSFFPEEGELWHWPQQGIVLDGELTIFLYALSAKAAPEDGSGGSANALGFRYQHWLAVRVENPEMDPPAWRMRHLPVPDTGTIAMLGAALFEQDDYVYAYGVSAVGDHALYLVRWSRSEFVRGDLTRPELWSEPGGQFARGPPAIVAEGGQTEFSVLPRPKGRYLLLQTRGFGAAHIEMRVAERPGGPFEHPVALYRPPEAERHQVLVYSVRAHPEQQGADLVLTYATNTLDAATLFGDLSLYFPRFVRVTLPAH